MEDMLASITDTDSKSQALQNSKCELNCNSVPFSDLCRKFDEVEKTSGAAKKFRLIFNKDLQRMLKGQSIFPLMRLVLPLIDSDREKYGLKQTAVAATYVDALHLDKKTSEDAQRLIYWKDPTKVQGVEANKIVIGDFGSILEDVLKSRVRSDPSKRTIGEVNSILDVLACVQGREAKTKVIRDHIINHFCASEQKWLMRIVFQDLKIGLKFEQVLQNFSPTALNRYNECTNLRTVCEEECAGVEMQGLQLFVQFAPMLAKGFSRSTHGQVAAVEAAMKGQPFLMDIKLDGERMMLHMKGNEVMFFSRNGNDYTEKYKPLADCVRQQVSCTECILDGEVCAWDNASKSFCQFGRNEETGREEREARLSSLSRGRSSVVGTAGTAASNEAREWEALPKWLCYIVFDVVYMDGPSVDRLVRESCVKFKYTGPGSGCEEEGENDLPVTATSSGSSNNNNNSSSSSSSSRLGISGAMSATESHYQPVGEITHMPLAVRRDLLAKIVTRIDHRLEFVLSRTVASHDLTTRLAALEEFYNDATLAGEEGLVVKNLASSYELGIKSKAKELWVKMKPEYGDQTTDLDLIILGAYYGEGLSMRGKGLSTFLLGVRDGTSSSSSVGGTPSSSSGGSSGGSTGGSSGGGGCGYRTLCKVGTGYTFDQLMDLRDRIREVALPWDKEAPPPHLAHWRIGKTADRPNVFIPPEKSFVVELKCAEIVESTQFSAGITCRFPRLQRIRYDKPVGDVMTLQEVQEVRFRPRDSTQETLAKKGGGGGGVGGREKRRGAGEKDKTGTSTGGVGRVAAGTVDGAFRVSSQQVTRKGRIFDQMAFCVLGSDFSVSASLADDSASIFATGTAKGGGQSSSSSGGGHRSFTREELIDSIKAQGGVVVANPITDVLTVVGPKKTFQTTNLISTGHFDVIDFRYVADCLDAGRRLPLRAAHYLGCSRQTEEKIGDLGDVFGDSYTEDITPTELLQILQAMEGSKQRLETAHASLLGDNANEGKGKAREAPAAASLRRGQKRPAAASSASSSSSGEGMCDGSKLIKKEREIVEVLKDWKSLSSLGWREISRNFTLEEREVLDCEDFNGLWTSDVCVYFELGGDLGDCHETRSCGGGPGDEESDLKSLSPTLLALRSRMRLHGCYVTSHLHVAVTHIIVPYEGLHRSRAQVIQDRIRRLRLTPGHLFEKRIVGPTWAQKCLRAGRILEPDLDDIVSL